jgi:hypothetical protein
MVLIVVFELRVVGLSHKEAQKAHQYSQKRFVLFGGFHDFGL